MALLGSARCQIEREWRRCVRVRARLNSPQGWSEVAILNVSSRGLMIAGPTCFDPGTIIELRGGDQVIAARVVWRKGQRAGLQADTVLPVMDIIGLTERPDANGEVRRGPVLACRRARPRGLQPCPRWPGLLEQAVMVGMGALAFAGLASMSAVPIINRMGAIEAALSR